MLNEIKVTLKKSTDEKFILKRKDMSDKLKQFQKSHHLLLL